MLSDRLGVGGFHNHHIMATGMSPKPRSDARPVPECTTPERERAPSARTQALARLIFIVSIRMPQRSPRAGERRVSYCTPQGEAVRGMARARLAQSWSMMLSSELWTFRLASSYSMNPSLRNLFMKKLTRERVVPTISASSSCDSLGIVTVAGCGSP